MFYREIVTNDIHPTYSFGYKSALFHFLYDMNQCVFCICSFSCCVCFFYSKIMCSCVVFIHSVAEKMVIILLCFGIFTYMCISFSAVKSFFFRYKKGLHTVGIPNTWLHIGIMKVFMPHV